MLEKITTSICHECYRHIPAQRFLKGRSLMIRKNCPIHGTSEHMMEKESLFLNNIDNDKQAYNTDGYLLEITDRCNLECPHCYQMPDNKKKDKSLEDLVNEVKGYPNDGVSITVAGAEPTMRKDLFELIPALRSLNRQVNILTNGVILDNLDYVQKIKDCGTDFVTIGLNHPDYQGQATHDRQLTGIENCIKIGMRIKNINYTIENYSQIPFILDEIQSLKNCAEEFRIRGGADIGRAPEDERGYLSDLVYDVYKNSVRKGYRWDKIPADDNVYHYTVKINDVTHRLIQWADAKNVDLDELRQGPWGSFVPGQPLVNLMHAVILRDAAINKSMALPDQVPEEYVKK